MSVDVIQSLDDLSARTASLGDVPDKMRRSVICSLIGHSRIVETCLGYVHCYRCGGMIGDMLASAFNIKNCVIVKHDCDVCRANSAELTWRDTYDTPVPEP